MKSEKTSLDEYKSVWNYSIVRAWCGDQGRQLGNKHSFIPTWVGKEFNLSDGVSSLMLKLIASWKLRSIDFVSKTLK